MTNETKLKEMRQLAAMSMRELAQAAGLRSIATISLAEKRGLRLSPRLEERIVAVLTDRIRQRLPVIEAILSAVRKERGR
jgi:transcriptional regulator with XRE-family HTH domain